MAVYQTKAQRRSVEILHLRVRLPGQAVPGIHGRNQQDCGEGIREAAQGGDGAGGGGTCQREQKAARIRTVEMSLTPYLEGYKLSHRPKSILFAKGRLAHVKKALGNVVLSDLTDERIRGYIRQRQAEKVIGPHDQHGSGRTESRAIGQPVVPLWPKVRRAGRTEGCGPGAVHRGTERPTGWPEGPPHAPPAYVHSAADAHRHAAGEACRSRGRKSILWTRRSRWAARRLTSGTGRTIPINRRFGVDSRGTPRVVHEGVRGAGSRLITCFHGVRPSRPIQHATPRTLTWGWDELRKDHGRLVAAFMISGIPSPPGWPRTASLSPRCSR